MKPKSSSIFIKYFLSSLIIIFSLVCLNYIIFSGVNENLLLIIPILIGFLASTTIGILAQTRYKLKESNRAKEDILRRVSHDLRNPINGICGFAELLEQSLNNKDYEGAKESLYYINRSAEDLSRLVNDLLHFSKNSKSEIEYSEFDLYSIIDEAIANTRIQADNKSVFVKLCKQNNEHLLIESDRFHLKQVFINLITNAIKYNTESGYLLIFLEMLDSKFKIHFMDSGIGIPETKVEQIFSPFTRLEPESKEGYGLGLSICKRIVEALDGQIYCKSIIGDGSDFIIELPHR